MSCPLPCSSASSASASLDGMSSAPARKRKNRRHESMCIVNHIGLADPDVGSKTDVQLRGAIVRGCADVHHHEGDVASGILSC